MKRPSARFGVRRNESPACHIRSQFGMINDLGSLFLSRGVGCGGRGSGEDRVCVQPSLSINLVSLKNADPRRSLSLVSHGGGCVMFFSHGNFTQPRDFSTVLFGKGYGWGWGSGLGLGWGWSLRWK